MTQQCTYDYQSGQLPTLVTRFVRFDEEEMLIFIRLFRSGLILSI